MSIIFYFAHFSLLSLNKRNALCAKWTGKYKSIQKTDTIVSI